MCGDQAQPTNTNPWILMPELVWLTETLIHLLILCIIIFIHYCTWRVYRSHVLFDNVILVKCFVGKHWPEGFVLYSMCLVFCLFKCSNNLHLWTAFSPFCTLCAKNTRVCACARLYTTTIPEFLTHTSLPADALHQSKVHNILHITVTQANYHGNVLPRESGERYCISKHFGCRLLFKSLTGDSSLHKELLIIPKLLVKVTTDFLSALDIWELILLDLSAAFNTLNHSTILQRLRTMALMAPH